MHDISRAAKFKDVKSETSSRNDPASGISAINTDTRSLRGTCSGGTNDPTDLFG